MLLEELIYRIQFHDDEAAFNRLYLTFVVKLHTFACTILHNKELSEEVVNDVFVKVWLGRHRLDKIKNLQVYIYVAVKNGCLDCLRKLNAQKFDGLQIADSFYFYLPADPAQLLISKELNTKLTRTINNLPPQCKLIFKMVKEDGLTSKEVGAILGISHKTVFAQLSIALKKIADII